MPVKIDNRLSATRLLSAVNRVLELSAGKILSLERSWKPSRGAPVFTAKGKYTSRGWTEWTQGFQFGSALLQYDATGEEQFLEIGRRRTRELMATHVSHMGVHDHGFNNVSTYGNLWRLMLEGRVPHDPYEQAFYELALKTSGAVQAARWTDLGEGRGFIYSFNGPHSLFVDTVRSLRSLAVAHQLGHVLMGERDRKFSLLERMLEHATATAKYSIYYGEGRDAYDVAGRTAHEAIFNLNDRSFRCPNTQQGYSPFSTWTRGLAWGILGFAEQLEFLSALPRATRTAQVSASTPVLLRAASATADYYLAQACADGIPMWDTGAPELHHLGDYGSKAADPYNRWEPLDSSAAAIAAQGFLRLGNYLLGSGNKTLGAKYRQAGFTLARSLMQEPYLSTDKRHQGLLLHSVYHRPNGWDYIQGGQHVPNGESSMWGDYHLRELAVMILREAKDLPYPQFFARF